LIIFPVTEQKLKPVIELMLPFRWMGDKGQISALGVETDNTLFPKVDRHNRQMQKRRNPSHCRELQRFGEYQVFGNS